MSAFISSLSAFWTGWFSFCTSCSSSSSRSTALSSEKNPRGRAISVHLRDLGHSEKQLFGGHFGSKKRVKMGRNSWWINESRFMSSSSPHQSTTRILTKPQVFLISTSNYGKKQLLPKIRIRKHQVPQPPLPLVSQFQGQWFVLTDGKDPIILKRGWDSTTFLFQEHLLPELIGF